MGAITQLCNQAILLAKGQIKCNTDTEKAITQYMNSSITNEGFIDLQKHTPRKGNRKVLFKWVKVCNSDGQESQDFSIGDNIYISFCVTSNAIISNIKLAIQLTSSDGTKLCNVIDVDSGFQVHKLEESQIYRICFKDIRLYPDSYYISLWAGTTESIDTYDHVEDCLKFQIIDGGKLTMRHLPRSAGIYFFTPEWQQILV